MSVLEKIRQGIRDRDYYLSSHAEEEMAEDRFEREDLEYAILHGSVEKKMTHDPRGTRYRIAGPAVDGRSMHVICRHRRIGGPIIVTVYGEEEQP